MEQPFQKDMSHTTWDKVYARQGLRADLMPEWFEALALKAGDRVLEVGAGPGYVSLALAERVGPQGVVYAIDRSADALAYLEKLQAARGISQIQRLVADAATLDGNFAATSALITMVLHHTDDPAAILRNLHRLLPTGARIVIGEFDPEGPCEIGPPRRVRLAPDKVRGWCEAAGFRVAEERHQSPEHYMIVAERAP